MFVLFFLGSPNAEKFLVMYVHNFFVVGESPRGAFLAIQGSIKKYFA